MQASRLWACSPADSLHVSAALLKTEGLAQVDTLHFRITAEDLGRARAEDLAIVDDIGTVRYGKRFTDIVISDKDADTAPLQIRNDLLQLQHLNGVDSGERFVKKEEVRADDERARDLNA